MLAYVQYEINKTTLKNSPNESESTALTGVTIPGDVDVSNFAATLENASQIVRSSPVSQIIDLEAKKRKYFISDKHDRHFLIPFSRP